MQACNVGILSARPFTLSRGPPHPAFASCREIRLNSPIAFLPVSKRLLPSLYFPTLPVRYLDLDDTPRCPSLTTTIVLSPPLFDRILGDQNSEATTMATIASFKVEDLRFPTSLDGDGTDASEASLTSRRAISQQAKPLTLSAML